MLIAASVAAGLAGLLHVFIWYLESFAWRGRARAVFGTTPEQAEQTAEMAYNQGFYNLFLAIETGVGIVLAYAGPRHVGVALIVAGTASMLLAAVVLVTKNPDRAGAGVRQGALPLIALALLSLAGLLS